jgi:hypothetical protein
MRGGRPWSPPGSELQEPNGGGGGAGDAPDSQPGAVAGCSSSRQ